ncbi:hypothetical protein Tco_1298374, partial [Tanacetum coccineum]
MDSTDNMHSTQSHEAMTDSIEYKAAQVPYAPANGGYHLLRTLKQFLP